MARHLAGPAVRAGRRTLDRAAAQRYKLPREASGIVRLEAHGHAAPDRNSYAPTPWGLLEHLLPLDEVREEDVFLDLGCGMGRVVLEAAMHYPFARVVGVELVPHFADVARDVLERNRRRLRCHEFEIVSSDVLDYSVPEDVTVAYLYDPFKGPVFDAAMARLEASVQRKPRRLRVIYLTPEESDRLAQSGVHVRSGSVGLLRTGASFRYLICDLMPSG